MTEETLKLRGQDMLAIIADIRHKQEESARLLRRLEMQAHLYAQGIDPENVASYGYDRTTDKRRRPRVSEPGLTPAYNYVVMQDSTRQEIQPIPVA